MREVRNSSRVATRPGFPIEYANRVKDTVSDSYLLMQAENAMIINVIQQLGNSLLKF